MIAILVSEELIGSARVGFIAGHTRAGDRLQPAVTGWRRRHLFRTSARVASEWIVGKQSQAMGRETEFSRDLSSPLDVRLYIVQNGKNGEKYQNATYAHNNEQYRDVEFVLP